MAYYGHRLSFGIPNYYRPNTSQHHIMQNLNSVTIPDNIIIGDGDFSTRFLTNNAVAYLNTSYKPYPNGSSTEYDSYGSNPRFYLWQILNDARNNSSNMLNIYVNKNTTSFNSIFKVYNDIYTFFNEIRKGNYHDDINMYLNHSSIPQWTNDVDNGIYYCNNFNVYIYIYICSR